MKKYNIFLASCTTIYGCATIAGFIFTIISLVDRNEIRGKIESYCDDILTTCNMSIPGNGDFTPMWYVMYVPNAQHCRYKGEEKLDSGWKFVDCYYDSEESNCSSVECELTKVQKKDEKNLSDFGWIAIGLMVGGLVFATLCGLCTLIYASERSSV